MRPAKKLLSAIISFSLLCSTVFPGATLLAAPPPPVVQQEPFALPEAKIGGEYEYQFQSEGGLAPLTWRVMRGALPPGVKLETSGKLHGVPIEAQRDGYAFMVEVSDSSKTPQRAVMPFLLIVQALPLRIITTPKLSIIPPSSTGPHGPSNMREQPSSRVETNSPRVTEPDNLSASIDHVGNGAATEPRAANGANGNEQKPASTIAEIRRNALSTPALATRGDAPASTSKTTTPAPAPTATPTPPPRSGFAQICGRLRPVSLDDALAAIISLPTVRRYIAKQKEQEEETKAPNTPEKAPTKDENEAAKEKEATKKVAEGAVLVEKRRIKQARKDKRVAKQIGAESKKPGGSECELNKDEKIEQEYISALWKRIKHSRFDTDTTCHENFAVASGEQKEAVVELLGWFLTKMDSESWKLEVKTALGEDFSRLSKDTVRRQIQLLNQYLGNVIVRVRNEDKTVALTEVSDRDGNFTFRVPVVSNQSNLSGPKEKFIISTEGDDHGARREILLGADDSFKLDLPIQNRPASLMARAVVGYQQAGAAATNNEHNYFLDLFISKSLPWRQNVSPDFGEKARAWGAIRAISVPQSGDVTLLGLKENFVANIADLKVKDATRVFDYVGGFEYRVSGNNALLPSFDRETKQKFSLSLIASFGFVTPNAPVPFNLNPSNPAERAPQVYNLTPRLRDRITGLNPPPPDNAQYVAFVPDDRDRFFRQYYAGFRLQTFFFNRHNIPLQRFPAQWDITVGQNEYVTGGRLSGAVLRMDGYFPLPFEGMQYINLFGMAVIKPVGVKERTPLLLDVAPAGVKSTDSSVYIAPVSQFNRDYYRVGVGMDFIEFVKALKNLSRSRAAATSQSPSTQGGQTPTP